MKLREIAQRGDKLLEHIFRYILKLYPNQDFKIFVDLFQATSAAIVAISD